MTVRIISLAAFVALVTTAGCKKDSGGGSTTPPTDTPGIINVTTPGVNAIYTNGSSLNITGDLTDVDGLSQGKVEVKKNSDNSVLFTQTSSTGGVSFYRFNWAWTISGITTITPCTVKITCTDRYSRVVTKEVAIQLDN